MLFLPVPWVIPIPLGAADEDRRPARGTLWLVAINVLLFLLTAGALRRIAKLDPELTEIYELADWTLQKEYAARPLLETARQGHSNAIDFLENDASWRAMLAGRPAVAELEGYLAQAGALVGSEPLLERLWFVPARPTLLSLVTSMFLHADFFHLFGNMLFLWTIGGYLELKLSLKPYLALYLSAGLVATLAQWAANSSSTIPSLGASGAIAGLMGFTAFGFTRSRIRLLLVYGLGLLPRTRAVAVPAGVFLGCWILEQLFQASLSSNAMGGVAYGAHIGGFVFGGIAALAVPSLVSRRRTASVARSNPPPRPRGMAAPAPSHARTRVPPAGKPDAPDRRP